MNSKRFFDPNLLEKYNTNGPRYTSYPTALSFSESFYNDDLIKAVKTSPNTDLSLYIHIPFCHSLCYYCGCNKVVTRHPEKAEDYMFHLLAEITQRQELFKKHVVRQIHLGGGTPSFLSKQQLSNLIAVLKSHFKLSEDVEIGIEIDPRNLTLDYIDHLANIGFNRLSIGVQDIDPQVQKAINRVQSTELIEQIVERANKIGFNSVNLDLIYGLPHQTPERFERTVDKVIQMGVQRISLFSYAHLPERFPAQRKLRDEWLPNANQKLELMKLAIERFLDAGYNMIGMDHFAKPNDELAKAQKQQKLHRNFQGYTTHADCDLLGFGVSAISNIGDCFSQNYKQLGEYYQGLNETHSAVHKGVKLNLDDQIRGFVISQLMCNFSLDKSQVENLYDIQFDHYFKHSLRALQPFEEDNLIENSATKIVVKDKARLLIRNICMSFDAYIKNQQIGRYSRVI
ncbi:oxygen-independent coproporphyrinogen III oxidase [Aliiglaciecola sp. SL4]|uniref:oxygen-independent coproporphyrinogen III oxidase n=1 Tax=Aliiglaciecola sp. SL4 TaxID=3239806 RepID=UPI00355C3208